MKITLNVLIGAVLLLAGQMQAAVVGYWRFENDLLDSSGSGLNATGGAGFGYSANVPGSVINPGGLPNSASYDQGSAATTVPANAILSDTFGLGSFTVEAFVYLNPGADNFQQILQNDSGSQGIYFSVGTSMAGYVGGYNGFGVYSDRAVMEPLATETWYHVAWVGTSSPGNGTAVQFFLNGEATGTAAFFQANGAIHVSMSSLDWKIGGPSNNFNGLFDELRISNEALTPAEFLTAVPEPSTWFLLGLTGAAALIFRRNLRGAC